MNAATDVAAALRGAIVPFLLVTTALIVALLILLVVQRVVRDAIAARQRRLTDRYAAPVAAALGGDRAAVSALTAAPRGHREIIGDLLLDSVRAVTGEPAARAGDIARALALDARWTGMLRDPRWWRRAAATRALGVVGGTPAFDLVVGMLDDSHEEVRAAAVQSLGRLGDVRAIAPLIDRLPDQSRHQRVRIVEALRALGLAAGAELLAFVRTRPERLPLVSEVLAAAAGTAAAEDLIGWCGDEDAAIRAAAFSALGTVGVDDRGYYFALRGLADEDARVRAMAARALGRSGREDAAAYLAPRLDDDWAVAAHSARALARLAGSGRAALEAVAAQPGQAGTLARQMLWEARVAAR